GGDFQGANPDVKNAERTVVSRNATIRADSRASGDGGKVVVWADKVTVFKGKISAQGGSESGAGGTVEVSGKYGLAYSGTTDLRASHGSTGSLLLDPDTI